ncbi:hypothetical protein JHK87_016592 [Glycine soja]|nr:hypothetical protein JHK87_016592 [Glycine soja]
MESLTSICEVVLPPLPMDALKIRKEDHDDDDSSNKSLQSFLDISASRYPIPHEVAEMITKRSLIETVILIRVVLWLLATRLGTLLLCGFLCLGENWPYINKFSNISLEKREKIMQKWLKHRFLTPIRLTFACIKVLCLFVFFSWVDENGDNPAWKAIGYEVPADEKMTNTSNTRPLEKGIIETMNESDSTLQQSLANKGLNVTLDSKSNILKVKCDALVVGSGCGGGVAAAVLSSAGHKVVVLEKGNYFTPQDYSSLEGPSMNQLYETGGILASVDSRVLVLAGSTVGDAVERDAVIITGCKAERFLLESNRSGNGRKKKCLGVTAKTLNSRITMKLQIEAKVTISAGGALLTPPLLISSGLKNKNIGKNLHLHPVLMTWGYFPESNDSEFKGNVYEGGIITSVHKVPSPDSNSDSRAIIETPLLGPASFAALCPWESGQDFKERMLNYPRTSHLITIIRDMACGQVTTEGRISYKLNEVDKENMKAGLKQALRILIAAGAVEVGTHRSDGQRLKCDGIGENEVQEFLDSVCPMEGALSPGEKWNIYSSAHQMGSCRMGVSEKEGAVDENGETWEAEGLFVCDASVLPSAVGVNPMITVQSTAYCISNRIVDYLRRD